MPFFSSNNSFTTSTGRDTWSWPVLMLLLAVLVPSGGVLWMMREAMESERFAVRQRMTDLYDAQLESARLRINERWGQRLVEIAREGASISPSQQFATVIADGLADSVVVWGADEKVLYPNSSSTNDTDTETAAWRATTRIETTEHNLSKAAAAYGKLADAEPNTPLAARALQAQARCLLGNNDQLAAIQTLTKLSEWNGTPQPEQRNLPANAELQLLELLEPASPEWKTIALRLQKRLADYATNSMPGVQRRFLMRELKERWAKEFSFPTLKAETLAAKYLATEYLTREYAKGQATGLHATSLDEVWEWYDSTNDRTLLLRTATLKKTLAGFVNGQLLPTGIHLHPLAPNENLEAELAAPLVSLSPALPNWKLAITTDGNLTEKQQGSERTALFAWTALAVIAATLLITSLVIRVWQKQLRIARLKNDLVATVSHELKTPLSSIRLLVDTLLDQDHHASAEQTREYLEHISHENARLTRLIDNFLTFSRMERGKRAVNMHPLDARTVIAEAVTTVQERFAADERTELIVETDEATPVCGDVDLLVTAVVNLLDNAWKYSGETKRIVVACKTVADRVLITVQDNGIGLPTNATDKIFGRFYQIDQRLARSQEGCGLGLSIVKYLIEAHQGTVSVKSQLGTGSTFTISLPADNSPTSNKVGGQHA